MFHDRVFNTDHLDVRTSAVSSFATVQQHNAIHETRYRVTKPQKKTPTDRGLSKKAPWLDLYTKDSQQDSFENYFFWANKRQTSI